MSKPTEGPILMNAPMVRATMRDAKTQTRRLDGLHRINESPDEWEFIRWQEYPDGLTRAVFEHRQSGESCGVKCKYRNVARLWVRETFNALIDPGARKQDVRRKVWNEEESETEYWVVDYLADGNHTRVMDRTGQRKWRPSIHMPRWASRITLEIADVRVERVRDISEEDVRAEGVLPVGIDPESNCDPWDFFADLWDSINGNRPGCSWADNPWVFAITFRRVAP